MGRGSQSRFSAPFPDLRSSRHFRHRRPLSLKNLSLFSGPGIPSRCPQGRVRIMGFLRSLLHPSARTNWVTATPVALIVVGTRVTIIVTT